jgi:hypothetical protein
MKVLDSKGGDHKGRRLRCKLIRYWTSTRVNRLAFELGATVTGAILLTAIAASVAVAGQVCILIAECAAGREVAAACELDAIACCG